jgi:hypothetical protein
MATFISGIGMCNRRKEGINCKNVQSNRNMVLREWVEKFRRNSCRIRNSWIIWRISMMFASNNLSEFVEIEFLSSDRNNCLIHNTSKISLFFHSWGPSDLTWFELYTFQTGEEEIMAFVGELLLHSLSWCCWIRYEYCQMLLLRDFKLYYAF